MQADVPVKGKLCGMRLLVSWFRYSGDPSGGATPRYIGEAANVVLIGAPGCNIMPVDGLARASTEATEQVGTALSGSCQ